MWPAVFARLLCNVPSVTSGAMQRACHLDGGVRCPFRVSHETPRKAPLSDNKAMLQSLAEPRWDQSHEQSRGDPRVCGRRPRRGQVREAQGHEKRPLLTREKSTDDLAGNVPPGRVPVFGPPRLPRPSHSPPQSCPLTCPVVQELVRLIQNLLLEQLLDDVLQRYDPDDRARPQQLQRSLVRYVQRNVVHRVGGVTARSAWPGGHCPASPASRGDAVLMPTAPLAFPEAACKPRLRRHSGHLSALDALDAPRCLSRDP